MDINVICRLTPSPLPQSRLNVWAGATSVRRGHAACHVNSEFGSGLDFKIIEDFSRRWLFVLSVQVVSDVLQFHA